MMLIIQTRALNLSLILATLKRMNLKQSTLLADKPWALVQSVLALYTKTACATCVKETRAQISHVISKPARSFCNKKFLLNKFKNCLPRAKLTC